MLKYTIKFIIICTVLSCNDPIENNNINKPEKASKQLARHDTIEPTPPKNYFIVSKTFGHLDRDSIPEVAVAYDIGKETINMGVPRCLIIYKYSGNNWTEWKRSNQVLLGSLDGGMMGDPFESINISDYKLLVSHAGGSSWKWGYEDTYELIGNELHLTKFQSIYGKVCEYWLNIEYNALHNKVEIKKEYETCTDTNQYISKTENETFEWKKPILTLENRNDSFIRIISPKYKHDFVLSDPEIY
jgi:hypothetical protein